jgi:hypothetical protein
MAPANVMGADPPHIGVAPFTNGSPHFANSIIFSLGALKARGELVSA